MGSPVADMADAVNRTLSTNLEGISNSIHRTLDRNLKRKQLEESVIIDSAKLRIQQENYDRQHESRVRRDEAYIQSLEDRSNHQQKTEELAAYELLGKNLDAEAADLQMRKDVAEITGEDSSAVDQLLETNTARRKELQERMLKTLAPSPHDVPVPQEKSYNFYGPQGDQQVRSGVQLPQRANDQLGFDGYNNLFSVTPNQGNVTGQDIVRAAAEWEGKDYKKGEYARCADFACQMLEDVGFGLGKQRSDLVYELNKDSVGQYVEPNELQDGDLVILRDTYQAEHGHAETHVGIFNMRDGRPGMIHRSTRSKPVAWAPLDEGSYADKVMNGRRLVPSSPDAVTQYQVDGNAFSVPNYSAGIKGDVTAYSPQKSGEGVEGGYESAKPGLDGVNQVRTLEDYFKGDSEYITISGDPSLNGKEYIIPNIQYKTPAGQTYNLTNVRAVVHDTGSAFKGQPEGRFDIPVARDAGEQLMADNHALWSNQEGGVQFIPREQTGPMPTEQRYSYGPKEPVAQSTYTFGDEGSVVINDNNPANPQDKSLIINDNAIQAPTASPSVTPDKPKITADRALSIYSSILSNPNFSEAERKVRANMIAGAIRSSNPAIFDEEYAAIADEVLARQGSSRTDFTQSLPQEMVNITGASRAMDIYNQRATERRQSEIKTKEIDNLQTEIDKVSQSILDNQFKMVQEKDKGEKIGAETYKFLQDQDTLLKGRLEDLNKKMSVLVPPVEAPAQETPKEDAPISETGDALLQAALRGQAPQLDFKLNVAQTVGRNFDINPLYLEDAFKQADADNGFGMFEKFFGSGDVGATVGAAMNGYLKTRVDEYLNNPQKQDSEFSAVRELLSDDETMSQLVSFAADLGVEVPSIKLGKTVKIKGIGKDFDAGTTYYIPEQLDKYRDLLLSNPAMAVGLFKTFSKKNLRSELQDSIVRQAKLNKQQRKQEALAKLGLVGEDR